MDTDNGFYREQLQSLERFGVELSAQLDALRGPSDRLGLLAGGELPLGDFAEARALALRQLTAARQMTGLLQAVREAVSFAGEVTRVLATRHEHFDRQAAAAFGAGKPQAG
jgi:hypothetical protein